MTEHTPGPWEAIYGRHDAVVYNGDIGTIATLNDEMTDYHANAELIAAAPDMLAALKDLQREIRQAVKFDVKKHYSLMVADVAASKVIAKAEGRYK